MTQSSAAMFRAAQTMVGHDGAVNVVRFNRIFFLAFSLFSLQHKLINYLDAGTYCLSGGSDKTVKLWNPFSGKQLKSFSGHSRDVTDLVVYF